MHRDTQIKDYELTPFTPDSNVSRYATIGDKSELLLYVVEYVDGFRDIRAFDKNDWENRIIAFAPYTDDFGEQLTAREPIYWQKAPF